MIEREEPLTPESGSSADPDPGLPIAEVSHHLGVPMPTLRSWELRYGIPSSRPPPRQAPSVLADGPPRPAPDARRDRPGKAGQPGRRRRAGVLAATGPAAEHREAILRASERADPLAVRAALDEAQRAMGLGPCLDDVLLPAMQQVGLWWETGRCTVESEHLTTEAARSWLENVNSFAPVPVRASPIVLACGPTDLHTIGLESLSLLLRYDGWSCRVLGARTSVPAVTTAIHATGAVAVVIVSHLSSGRARAVQALHAADRPGVTVFYAGNAFTAPRSRRNLPGRYLGTRLQQACGLIGAELA